MSMTHAAMPPGSELKMSFADEAHHPHHQDPDHQQHQRDDRGFFQRAKRRLHTTPSLSSIVPKFLEKSKHEAPIKAVTLMPTTHRENTALHILIDTLPSLPSLGAPSLSFPFFPSKALACFNASSALNDEPNVTSPNSSSTLDQQQQQLGGDPPTPTLHHDPLKRLKGNVVCLGGYRGSVLRDATTGKRLWLPIKVGFGIRKPDLSIGLEDGDEERVTEKIVPGKMLMTVGGILDLGKRLKDKLKALDSETGEVSFHSWGYDWRLGLELSSSRLLEYLEALKKESAARGEGPNGTGLGATVIAHSMGGLVALHALAKASDPTVFNKLVCAGTPFHGCVNALGPLKLGDGFLLNKEICSPRVVFSMRSTFYFLPSSGECFERPDGTPIPVNFFDAETWSRDNLSPVTAGLFSPPSLENQARRNLLKKEAETSVARPVSMAVDDEIMEDLDIGGREERRVRNAKGSFLSHDSSDSDSEREVELSADPDKNEDGSDGPNTSNEATTGLPSEASIKHYLNRTLERVERFQSELVNLFDPAKAAAGLYPPIALLTSSKTPTVRGVLVKTDTIAEQNYEHLLYGPGDGIVLHESSCSLPGRWGELCRGVVESSNGHVSLVGDVDSMRKCLAMLE